MFDVITIGAATRDAFVKSSEFYIEKERHVRGGRELAMPLGAKIEIKKIIFTTGGGATNTAVTFARQGFKTTTVLAVGDDVSGRAIREELKKERIDTRFFVVKKQWSTAYSILLHPEGGERTVLVYRGASEHLSEKEIKWHDMKTQWFSLSSLAGNMRLLSHVLTHAKKDKSAVAYNPGGKELIKKNSLGRLLGNIAVLIVNREEASLLTGIPSSKAGSMLKKMGEFCRGINVITDARNGVWVSDGKKIYKGGIYRERRIADRTGAGDAFASGFVAGLMRHCAAEKLPPAHLPEGAITYAIRLGSANATAKVEGIGAKFGLLTRRQFELDTRWRSFPLYVEKL